MKELPIPKHIWDELSDNDKREISNAFSFQVEAADRGFQLTGPQALRAASIAEGRFTDLDREVNGDAE